MKNSNFLQSQVFWYLDKSPAEQLRQSIKTEVLIVGAGIAGLSAAQSFNEKGCSVTLIEKNFCGAGASGKSSGFLTPDSELGLAFFVNEFGQTNARKLWDFGTSGVHSIRNNIKSFSIQCDYQPQDVLVVANTQKGFSELQSDHQVFEDLSFKSFLYPKNALGQVIGSHDYYGAIRYPDTFGINCFMYCQAMKEILKKKGVKIFEDTPALSIDTQATSVTTPHGTITADYIIVCVDRFLPELHKLVPDVYHAQTFLMVSEPLEEKDVRSIFPDQRYMVWDTDFIYQYYRIIENNRFLIGGSDYLSIFWGKEQFNLGRMYRKLAHYAQRKFPQVSFNFEYMWPGLIGVSKDILPIGCPDSKNNHIYYITDCAGLPWAAALGSYSAERMLEGQKDLDRFFSVKRKYPVGRFAQRLLGKRLTFALANFINLYFKN